MPFTFFVSFHRFQKALLESTNTWWLEVLTRPGVARAALQTASWLGNWSPVHLISSTFETLQCLHRKSIKEAETLAQCSLIGYILNPNRFWSYMMGSKTTGILNRVWVELPRRGSATYRASNLENLRFNTNFIMFYFGSPKALLLKINWTKSIP